MDCVLYGAKFGCGLSILYLVKLGLLFTKISSSKPRSVPKDCKFTKAATTHPPVVLSTHKEIPYQHRFAVSVCINLQCVLFSQGDPLYCTHRSVARAHRDLQWVTALSTSLYVRSELSCSVPPTSNQPLLCSLGGLWRQSGSLRVRSTNGGWVVAAFWNFANFRKTHRFCTPLFL